MKSSWYYVEYSLLGQICNTTMIAESESQIEDLLGMYAKIINVTLLD